MERWDAFADEVRRRYNHGYLWMDRPTPVLVTGGPVLQTTFQPHVVTTTTAGVVKTRRDTSHTFHLIMTIITGGAWAFVWLGMTIWHQFGLRRRSRVRTRTTVARR